MNNNIFPVNIYTLVNPNEGMSIRKGLFYRYKDVNYTTNNIPLVVFTTRWFINKESHQKVTKNHTFLFVIIHLIPSGDLWQLNSTLSSFTPVIDTQCYMLLIFALMRFVQEFLLSFIYLLSILELDPMFLLYFYLMD